LGGADGCEVAVTLIRDDQAAGIGALQRRGHGGSAAVRGLHVADIEIIVSEHGAADGTDKDRAILQAHVRDGFGDEFVHNAVAAVRPRFSSLPSRTRIPAIFAKARDLGDSALRTRSSGL